MRKVFLLGPGYVGREIIDLLLAEESYEVTTIVRCEAAGKELEADDRHYRTGDLNDKALISKLASESDIVFHTATADHLESAEAICEGVSRRAAAGQSTIYLHQSGASVLSDHQGQTLNDKIFSDKRPEDLDALPDDAPHRKIDLALLRARKELGDRAKIFIMMPPIIYGVPTLARFAIKNGFAGYADEGKAAWGTIHVRDIAQAYMTILHWLENSPAEVGREQPYFFCESGETSWRDLSDVIGSALHKAGKLDDGTARSIPESQYDDLFGN